MTGDRVHLWSRFGNELTERFPAIRDAIAALGTDHALVDSEAIVMRNDGYCDFGALLERRRVRDAPLIGDA